MSTSLYRLWTLPFAGLNRAKDRIDYSHVARCVLQRDRHFCPLALNRQRKLIRLKGILIADRARFDTRIRPAQLRSVIHSNPHRLTWDGIKRDFHFDPPLRSEHLDYLV